MLPKVFALIMIIATMLSAGLQVNRERLAETFRQYGLLGRALLANFVLLPAIAYVLVRVFHVQGPVATGILLMAMAPGVPFLVNSAGRKQGGSLAFALEIAFVFSALSVITIPITASLLLPPEALTRVPAAKFLTTLLLFQLVPLVVGALIEPRLKPDVVTKAIKALHIVFLVAVVGLLVLLFGKVVASVTAVHGSGQLVIIAIIGLFALGMGWIFGGPDREYRRTLSIATLMRNIGLCTLIGTGETFAGTLVTPTIIAYFVVTFALSLPIRMYLQRSAGDTVVAV